MSKQNSSCTEPNSDSLKAQIDWIRVKLEKSENSGFTDDNREEILKQSKSLLDA